MAMPGEEKGLDHGAAAALGRCCRQESGERAIVSESRVRIDGETEQAPVKDGEVGEADVFGELDEREEPGASGEPGEAGDGAAGAAAVADDLSAVAGEADAAADGGDAAADGADAAADGGDELDPVALYTEELRRLPGEWYVVHSYAG